MSLVSDMKFPATPYHLTFELLRNVQELSNFTFYFFTIKFFFFYKLFFTIIKMLHYDKTNHFHIKVVDRQKLLGKL